MMQSHALAEPMPEMADLIVESGGNDLNLCFQCGQCTATCPWGRVRDHKVRHMLRLAQAGLDGYEEEIWFCATCNHCVDRCHRGVDIPGVIRAARRLVLEGGRVEESQRMGLSGLEQQGNPFLEDEAKRNAWVAEEKAPAFDADKEFLLFACCENSFQDHNRKVMTAVVKLLDYLEVNYGAFGSEEHCCGDLAFQSGADDTFATSAGHNIGLFDQHAVAQVLTTSPHCMQQLGTHYAEHGGRYKVQHLIQHLHKLLKEERFHPCNELDLKVTYHDPCYLGRHAEVYDAPRDLIKAIPGVEYVEMERHGPEALCCGGGGGRMFQDTHMAERFANQRLEEAVATGADVLVTACPYCIANFDEALLNLELEGKLKIMDLTELLWEAVA